MANVDAAFGYRPIGKVGSGVNNAGTSLYAIGDDYNTSIFKGDHVMQASGLVIAGTAGGDNNLGVFNGCFYIDPTSAKPTWSNITLPTLMYPLQDPLLVGLLLMRISMMIRSIFSKLNVMAL